MYDQPWLPTWLPSSCINKASFPERGGNLLPSTPQWRCKEDPPRHTATPVCPLKKGSVASAGNHQRGREIHVLPVTANPATGAFSPQRPFLPCASPRCQLCPIPARQPSPCQAQAPAPLVAVSFPSPTSSPPPLTLAPPAAKRRKGSAGPMAPSVSKSPAPFPMADTSCWSPLQHQRTKYTPDLPPALQTHGVDVILGSKTTAIDPLDCAAIAKEFPLTYGLPVITIKASDADKEKAQSGAPLRVAVLFHGHQSPGAHSIVAGVFDSLDKLNPGSTLLGFVDGVSGLLANETLELTADVLSHYRNQGGLDLLGRSREEHFDVSQLQTAKATCQALRLDGLILVGGSATATDAARIAEYFAAEKVATQVVAAPCTIDNDLKGPFVPVTAGFDTACRVYSELISNICTDALSAEKYYFFIRLMGRRSSHIALECALRTQANMVILGEEVLLSNLTLYDITKKLCDAICDRSKQKGKHHGVILFPEGLIEHIPEVHSLLEEINGLLREGVEGSTGLEARLSPWSKAVLAFLPDSIRAEILTARDSDGSVRFSKIETEKLFMMLVETEMARRTKAGLYQGKKFNGITYFFGYQARGSLPSNFDCCYAYALGRTSARLVASSANGYMATVSGLQSEVAKWQPGGVPLTALMTVNRWLMGSEATRIGVPAVNPSKMDIRGKAFQRLQENKEAWLMEDLYRNPGPLQFQGPGADSRPVTLQLEGVNYFSKIAALEKNIDKVKELVRPGVSPDVLQVALHSLENVVDVVSLLLAQDQDIAN